MHWTQTPAGKQRLQQIKRQRRAAKGQDEGTNGNAPPDYLDALAKILNRQWEALSREDKIKALDSVLA